MADNAPKKPLFTLDQRVHLVERDLEPLSERGYDIEVRAFDRLLVHFAEEVGAHMVFRGLRAVSDFEYEFQMTGMNAQLNPEVQTLFLMASDKHQYVSSAFVKEISRMGGDVSPFVSAKVKEALIRAQNKS